MTPVSMKFLYYKKLLSVNIELHYFYILDLYYLWLKTLNLSLIICKTRKFKAKKVKYCIMSKKSQNKAMLLKKDTELIKQDEAEFF